jgi:hypothetical protein
MQNHCLEQEEYQVSAAASTIGKPLTAGKIEPLLDITTTDKDVKVVVKIQSINFFNIRYQGKKKNKKEKLLMYCN